MTAPTLSVRWLALAVALLLLGLTPVASSAVLTGIDVLADQGFAPLRGKRVGLIGNHTSVDRQGRPTWRLLQSAPGVRLVALFGAEHGFDGSARAGVEIPDRIEASTRLPIYSLYGPGRVRQPTRQMLEGIDILLYDLQDTGCRSYTYISTLGLAMEACAKAGVRFMVLDRPNPLGGVRVEGPQLDLRFKSFVGQWPVPYVYGMTPGELARLIQGSGWIQPGGVLEVIPMRGWHRRMSWKETGLRWIPSSPNVPFGDTPMYLVATGILGEIGGVNLGTGSALSFRIITAPWLDSTRLAAALNRQRLAGIVFEPFDLDGDQNPANGAEQHGVRLRVTQPATAPIASVGYLALEAIRSTSGRDLFQLAANRGRNWEMFDKVTGSDQTRRALQQGLSARRIVESWQAGIDAFKRQRKPYLIYPESAPTRPTAAPSDKSRKPASSTPGTQRRPNPSR